MTAKKSKIPYFFFVFFAVIFAVDAYYVYISKKTWRGVITEDSYRKGLDYNEVVADAKKQEELGWNLKISYKNLKNKNGELEILLVDKNNNRISDVLVTANFKRPTQEGQDFSQELKFIDGKYFAKIEFPLAGQWDFQIVATKGEDSFRQSKRYVVQ